jgi:uncharacterized membrane protein
VIIGVIDNYIYRLAKKIRVKVGKRGYFREIG